MHAGELETPGVALASPRSDLEGRAAFGEGLARLERRPKIGVRARQNRGVVLAADRHDDEVDGDLDVDALLLGSGLGPLARVSEGPTDDRCAGLRPGGGLLLPVGAVGLAVLRGARHAGVDADLLELAGRALAERHAAGEQHSVAHRLDPSRDRRVVGTEGALGVLVDVGLVDEDDDALWGLVRLRHAGSDRQAWPRRGQLHSSSRPTARISCGRVAWAEGRWSAMRPRRVVS